MTDHPAELALLRRQLDLAQVRVFRVLSGTKRLECSPGLLELLGLAPDQEVSFAELQHLLTVAERERLTLMARAARAAQEPFEAHTTVHRRDGTTRRLTVRAEPLLDASGANLGFHGVVLDHTSGLESAAVQQLSTVAARTSNAVVVTDVKGAIEWVNAGFTRLTGWTLDEVLGRRPGDFLQGSLTNPATIKLMHDRGLTLEAFKVEVINYTKQGVPYWVELDVEPMRDEAGVITHLMAIETDISARKEAEAAREVQRTKLEESLATLRAVLDGTEHSVIATDVDGVVTLFNRGAERMLGYAAAEVVGKKTPGELHDPSEIVAHAGQLSAELGVTIAPGFATFVERARRGGSESRVWTYVRNDGTRLAVSLSVTALRGADGSLRGFLGVASDITAQRALEAERRAFTDRLMKLGRHVPGVVYQYQLFPDGRSCFPWASEGIRAIYGVTPDEVKHDASKVFAALHPDDLARVSQSISQSARQLTPWRDEYRARSADGVVRWLLGHATPEAQADGSVLWHGFISDITERKVFEVELVRAREAALEASRVKSQFLANMSHEIRTPLNGILGMTQLLLDSSPTAEQRTFLDAVSASGRTLLALINDILDLSKVESGRMEFERLPFSLREVLHRVVQTVSVRVAEKGLAVRLTVTPQVPGLLLGDPTRLGQVLLNLVGNAIKFTDRGDVRLEAAWEGGQLRVGVEDSGIGISAQALSRLFDPFTQADGSITRRYGGTGLGLAISRRLVEGMGGALTVTSREGQGSCFTVELPLAVAEAPPVSARASSASELPTRSLQVLVAEDNAINALVVCTLLKRDGHHVVHVTTGRGAVAATDGQAFDLVLMDMQMPECDGLEATRFIRSREQVRGGHLRICALTANAMTGDIERCREAGMDDYLTKPVELDSLRLKLASLA